jgi:predicted nucleic acid-binding protein
MPLDQLVIDASAAINLTLAAYHERGVFTRVLGPWTVHVPAHFDLECCQAARRRIRHGQSTIGRAIIDLTTCTQLVDVRHEPVETLDTVFAMRDNISAYDASYVALAVNLGIRFVTADERLARACQVAAPDVDVRILS